MSPYARYLEDDGFVIRAETEAAARHLARVESQSEIWVDREKTTCEEISVCGNDEIILASNVGS